MNEPQAVTSPSAKRRVIISCFILAALPFIDVGLNHCALAPENDDRFIFAAYFAVAGCAVILAASVVVVPLAVWCIRRKRQRVFVLVASTIGLLSLGSTLLKRWQAPPRIGRLFQVYFESPLPSHASEVRMSHPPFDAVTYAYFHCQPDESAALIRQLGMHEVEAASDQASDLLDLPASGPPKDWPHCEAWKGSRIYHRRYASGTGVWLYLDADAIRVYLMRNVLAYKSDEDLAPEPRL